MLPKEYRLDKSEIKRIMRFGKKIDNQLFTLRVWYDETLSNSKFAFVVSTKVDKRATVRNNIKRKFRVAVKYIANDSTKTFKKGSYVFIIKDASLKTLKTGAIMQIIREVAGAR
jgi:ribonuclease P protein component